MEDANFTVGISSLLIKQPLAVHNQFMAYQEICYSSVVALGPYAFWITALAGIFPGSLMDL